MKRPTMEIEKLRSAIESGKINPEQIYSVRLQNGKVFSFTGAEMIETGKAYVELADAEKSGDKEAMKKAIEHIVNS